jgi:hypothetical protein
VDYGFGGTGPSRYAVNLALRNADVREITGDIEQQDLQGRLSASLAIEGIDTTKAYVISAGWAFLARFAIGLAMVGLWMLWAWL